jgi:formyltetrahydrofolate synthetase
MTDLEIAQAASPRPIMDVAADLGLTFDDLELYGANKAKISTAALNRLLASEQPNAKIVLVTAITPTPAGEGKTTTTIGLTQGLCQLGKRAISCQGWRGRRRLRAGSPDGGH